MKSTWVMTEEEKQDKKMRAMAKKSEGERAQKAKAPPKSANGTQPQTGTLQSYMARRKTCMHRRPSRSSSSTVTSEQVETVPKKQKSNGKSVKKELPSTAPSSFENVNVKMEQDPDNNDDHMARTNDTKQRIPARRKRQHDNFDLSDDSSFDDAYFRHAARAKIETGFESATFFDGDDGNEFIATFSPLSMTERSSQSNLNSPFPEPTSVPGYSSANSPYTDAQSMAGHSSNSVANSPYTDSRSLAGHSALSVANSPYIEEAHSVAGHSGLSAANSPYTEAHSVAGHSGLSAANSPYSDAKSLTTGYSSMSPAASPGQTQAMKYSTAVNAFSLPNVPMAMDTGYDAVADQSSRELDELVQLLDPQPSSSSPCLDDELASVVCSEIALYHQQPVGQIQNLVIDEQLFRSKRVPVPFNDLSLDVYPFDQVRRHIIFG